MKRTSTQKTRRPKPTARQQRYRDALRDPRWQKRRLEVFQRDNWTCQDCRATTQELHVHHTRYVPGRLPWEVPLRTLRTLCKACHAVQHRKKGVRKGEGE